MGRYGEQELTEETEQEGSVISVASCSCQCFGCLSMLLNLLIIRIEIWKLFSSRPHGERSKA